MTFDQETVSLRASSDGLQAVIDTAQEAAVPEDLDSGSAYSLVVPAGATHVLFNTDDRKLTPARKKGTVQLFDATSFAAYVEKHHEDARTELYADPTKPGVVAVLNGHGLRSSDSADPETGWGDHRAVLLFRETDAWKRWAGLNGKLVSQTQFAEHIEDSVSDIVEPPGADMLELAGSFQAHSSAHFESAKNLASGERQLVYREEINATAGRDSLTIPKEFVIGVAPYEGSARYRVTARLRYRIGDGRLQIGYFLDRPEDVLRTAFDDVLKQVQDETGRVALLGVAPA